MTNVSTQIDRIVASNRAGFGAERLCFTQHLSSLLDDILAFPTHADNGTRTKELDKSPKEGFLLQVGVMGGGHFFRRPNHFQTHQFVATLFEPSNNITHQTPLDTVGFDGQEGTFLVGTGFAVHRECFARGNAVVVLRPHQSRDTHGRRSQGGARPRRGQSTASSSGNRKRSRRKGATSQRANNRTTGKHVVVVVVKNCNLVYDMVL
mmetsp:Transcript_15108/g.28645  ORF Transcript_15108/g.28645 Transcript_15108/m.28645 type:complete len:207 (+) Transcript_15108:255-875(+)